ncbi:hypothetical protein EVAR_35691_1 [Eumeta japonica]|uniref:Uncharacterized protein n=1 Tax=Eumeta variegata TaxID=151549 RepID=A0A4C1VDQ5_EUMVA|nr:hypothetical protein EVAR_35691_1 [Eumeta japonica]
MAPRFILAKPCVWSLAGRSFPGRTTLAVLFPVLAAPFLFQITTVHKESPFSLNYVKIWRTFSSTMMAWPRERHKSKDSTFAVVFKALQLVMFIAGLISTTAYVYKYQHEVDLQLEDNSTSLPSRASLPCTIHETNGHVHQRLIRLLAPHVCILRSLAVMLRDAVDNERLTQIEIQRFEDDWSNYVTKRRKDK